MIRIALCMLEAGLAGCIWQRYRYNSRAAGGKGAFLQKVNTKFSRILLLWNTSKCLSMPVLKVSLSVAWI